MSAEPKGLGHRGRPHVLGHRGARARAPENTWSAFALALEEGACGIELDVRMTRDGALVIIHDPTLEGAGIRVAVGELTETQLDTWCLRHGFPMLPRLEEVVAWGRDRKALLNIELKGDVPNPAWMAHQTVRILARTAHQLEPMNGPARYCEGNDGTIILSSFHPVQVRVLAHSLPKVPVALLIHRDQWWARQLVGHMPATLRVLASLGAKGIHAEADLLAGPRGAQWIAALHQQGYFVNTWTVNDPALAEQLTKSGVDGIITDGPREILSRLGTRAR